MRKDEIVFRNTETSADIYPADPLLAAFLMKLAHNPHLVRVSYVEPMDVDGTPEFTLYQAEEPE